MWEGHSLGLGELWSPGPATKVFDERGPLRGGDHWRVGGAAAASEGRGRGPLSGAPPAPSRHVPLPYLPLTSPRPARAGPALISPSPLPTLLLGSDPDPLPRLQAAPQPPRPQVVPLAQSSFRAPGPWLHAASWAARAGVEARGCSFTTSLKYFGKPQSGAARKRFLACFGVPEGEDGGLVLREGRVLPNF